MDGLNTHLQLIADFWEGVYDAISVHSGLD